MKEYPVLFNTEMVKAILSGQKTQTRRLMKNNLVNMLDLERDGSLVCMDVEDKHGDLTPLLDFCPHGQSGSKLWVRETWAQGTASAEQYFYRANDLTEGKGKTIKWKPSIHMPRKACRLILEITNVRVERVQDITEEDAKAEGVESPEEEREEQDFNICPNCGGTRLYNTLGAGLGVIFDCDCMQCDTYKKRFINLWDAIYHNADANPWVWVIEFKKVTE